MSTRVRFVGLLCCGSRRAIRANCVEGFRGTHGRKVTIKLNDANYDAYRLASKKQCAQTTQKVSYAATSNGTTQTEPSQSICSPPYCAWRWQRAMQTGATTNVNGEAMPAWNVRHADQFVGALQDQVRAKVKNRTKVRWLIAFTRPAISIWHTAFGQ